MPGKPALPLKAPFRMIDTCGVIREMALCTIKNTPRASVRKMRSYSYSVILFQGTTL